ncbi:MAG: NAD(P)H-binding protein [Betaproteobacteria bacterium]|nr:NAD(P)H-binding protein [Betaproteobacteria bacterium]
MNGHEGIKRTALLVGGTGLVGRALLSLLLASDRYRKVHLLVRRVASDLPPSAKLKVKKVDFAQLPSSALPAADDVFIALGTTIKVAGSEHAFRQVDFDYVVNIARGALDAGAKRLAMVSAMGADPRSRVFYNRVKARWKPLSHSSATKSSSSHNHRCCWATARPLGQPARRAETWRPASLVGRLDRAEGVRPISARSVAAAMFAAVLAATPGICRLKSGAMQGGG